MARPPLTEADATASQYRLSNLPDPFAIAARRYERHGAARYLYDAAGFVRDCIEFRPGEGPTFYQLANLNDLVQGTRRLAVRGPHGLGKTTTKAWTVLWFALTRDAAGIDWKCVTTASAWRQLTLYLWPEIHKWARRIRWDVVGRPPFSEIHELQTLGLKLIHGQASAVATNNKELIEGAHADSVLYIFDEAKAIPADIFDAAEGAFSGAREVGLPEAFALAQSTPGDTAGRFYDIHQGKPGLEDWVVRHVTLADAIAAGRVAANWAQQRKLMWGPDSAIYHNRVLGEFHSSEEDVVIPLSWVEAANERYAMWQEQGKPAQFGRRVVGVDVAREGADLTVLADRIGPVVLPLTQMRVGNTMKVVRAVKERLRNATDLAVVDVIGVGAGVVDKLRIDGHNVHAFNASRGTKMRDRSGELGFINQRAAMWWTLREMLDPTFLPTLALPPDDDLIGELTAPKWKVIGKGLIQVESKEELRKRLGRSTDHADAVGQSLLTDTEFNQVESGAKGNSTAHQYQAPDTPIDERDGGAFGWEETA